MVTTRTGVFDPYVTRVASDWDETAAGERWQSIDGSLVFVDISGFTNLSEKLARRGRIGAEELTSVLNRVFGSMLDVAYSCGGSLLKFGGDALLLMFDSPEHVISAVGAAVEMRTALRESAKIPTSVGKIPLRMSVGVHTGPIDFFLVGDSHRELIITGPTASVTTEMEGTADAGEIVVSSAIKEAVPADFTGEAKGNGWILRKRSVAFWKCGPVVRDPISDDEMERFVPRGLRANLRSGLRESEHRIATVGFLKYKGIDAMMESGGPSYVAEALDELVQVVQREADAEGVTFLATDIDADGGKIILVAGVPGAKEDDEGRLLRTARRILDARPQLAIRLGVNRGHVFSGDVGTAVRSTYTIMGDTVNLAARLMAAADPGSLYASPVVIDRSTTMFRTEALEPFYVKGKEKPVQAFELFEETGTRPPDFTNELPFMGRETQIGVLREAMVAVKGGAGLSITITGDTGIGKTRLLQELHSLAGDALWVEVRGEPQGKDNTYFALSDPLRRLLGIAPGSQAEMAAALEDTVLSKAPRLSPFTPLLAHAVQIDMEDTPESADIAPRFRPDRTADALAELLEEIFDGPTVLAFDDAHWLDEGSSSVVRKLSEAARGRPWMLVATARTEGDFETVGTEMPLTPLERDDSRVIVVESTRSAPIRPAEVDDVVTRAGGNPLFLSEIIKAIRETGQASDLPDSLDSVVSSQIDQLPPLTKQVMRYSAVLGLSFRRDVLDELLAPEGLELDEATRRDLARYIEPDGYDRLRFLHAAVHDISYQGLSYRRRQELHARAGEVIERLAGVDPEGLAEFLATHFSAGGVHDKAWRYAVIAGDRARDRYALNEASAQYRLAVDAARRIESVSTDDNLRILRAQGDVLETLSRYEEAFNAFAAARQLRPDDSELQAMLMAKQGLIREKMGRLPTALSWFRRGLNLLEGVPGESSARPELMLAYAGIRFRQGKMQESIEWAQRALEEEGSTSAQRAHILHLLVAAYAHVGSPKARSTGEEALAIYEEIGDLVGMGLVLNNLGVNAFYRGHWDESIGFHSRAREVRRRSGHVMGAGGSINNLAEIYCDQGRLSEAQEMFEEALYIFESTSFRVGIALANANLGRTLTREGDLERAWEHLERARSLFVEMGAQAFVFETDVKIAEYHLFARQWVEAETLARKVLSSMKHDESTLMARTALHRVLGYCAVVDDRKDDAQASFLASLEVAEEAAALFEQAVTYEGMARTLREREQASEWTDRQAEIFAQLDVIATPVIPLD